MSKDQIKASIIQHTSSNGVELVTMRVEFPRFILAQINTHRTFSRNYQSSRAMPILKQMVQISEDPFMPVKYGTAKKGMVAGGELTGLKLSLAKGLIYGLSRVSLLAVLGMQKLGLSKEIANRYLEPWMTTVGLITATKDCWEAFFDLRCESDAQPEIQDLSNKIRLCIEGSLPWILSVGEWHIPYCEYQRTAPLNNLQYSFIDGLYCSRMEEGRAIRTGTAAAAQISYRTLELSGEKTDRVYSMLKLPEKGVYKDTAPHFSAAEHCARAAIGDNTDLSGNLNTGKYIQYRKLLELGIEEDFINE